MTLARHQHNQFAIPGMPNDLVKLIITYLPHYDQMVLRNVAWLFSQYIPHPYLAQLRAVIKALPYDIRSDEVEFDELTHKQMLKLNTMLLQLHQAYADYGRPSNCYKPLLHIYRMMKIEAANPNGLTMLTRVRNCNPFLRSVLLDIIYLKYSGEPAFNNFFGGNIKNTDNLLRAVEHNVEENRNFATSLQKHRMRLCRILRILNSKIDNQEKVNLINAKYKYKLSYNNHLIAKLELLVKDLACYSNIDLFNYLITQLAGSHSADDIKTFAKFVADITPTYKQTHFLAKPIGRATRPETTETVVAMVKAEKLIPSVEWCRSGPEASIAKRKKHFLKYMTSTDPLKRSIDRPLAEFPVWLRNLIFQPDLIQPEHKEFMMGLDLKTLPQALFNKANTKMTSQSIFALRNHFRLAEELDFPVNEQFINRGHSAKAIEIMIEHFQTLNYDVEEMKELLWIDAQALHLLVTSPIYQELRKLPQLNVAFYRWAALGFSYLNYTYTKHHDFFTSTLTRLTSSYTHYGVTNTTWLDQLCKLLMLNNEATFLIDIFNPECVILENMMEIHPGELIIAAALGRDAIMHNLRRSNRIPLKSKQPTSYSDLYRWIDSSNASAQDTSDFVFRSYFTHSRAFKNLRGNNDNLRCLLWFMGFHYMEEYYKPKQDRNLPDLLRLSDNKDNNRYWYWYLRRLTLIIFQERLLTPLEDQFAEIARNGFNPNINYLRQVSAVERKAILARLKPVFDVLDDLSYVTTILKSLGIARSLELGELVDIVDGKEWFACFDKAVSREVLETVLQKIVSSGTDIITYLHFNGYDIKNELQGLPDPYSLPVIAAPAATFFRPKPRVDTEAELKRQKPNPQS